MREARDKDPFPDLQFNKIRLNDLLKSIDLCNAYIHVSKTT